MRYSARCFQGLGFWVVLLALGACSTDSKKEREIDRGIAQESPTLDVHESVESASKIIQNSKKLTEAQKVKMLALVQRTHVDLDALRSSGSQIKSAMFKSLAGGTFLPMDIGILKLRLRENENKKIDVVFSSLFEVREILGYDPQPAPLDFELHNLYRDM
jgi:hypothetical protein